MTLPWRTVLSPVDRWIQMLEEVKAQQAEHPDRAAELFFGDHSTAALYRRRLEAGYVPSTQQQVSLDTSGFVFFVKHAGNKARLLAQYVGTSGHRRTPLRWIGAQEELAV